MTSRYHALFFAVSILISGTIMSQANAQTAQQPTYQVEGTLLNVSATAETTRVPDIATLSTGVVTENPDAKVALQSNSEKMNQVMAAIRKAGIADKDVRTSGINISPQYQYKENQAPRITGYQASNRVQIKVRDISKLSDVLTALVSSGSNDISGPNFEIDKPEEAYDEARQKALKQAQQRADMYAKALGLRVKRIVSINEDGGRAMPMPVMGMRKAMAMDASMESAPVSPGESTLTANLNIVFELDR